MSRHGTDNQDPVPECVSSSPPLPPDHVLDSGAVLLPGAFDQHGCPLIVFPVDGHARLSQLSLTQVVDFIRYFLRLHNKKESLASVVADLRQASIHTTRFIAETLLLLEQHHGTVHSVYVIQPKKKDVAKLLLKLLAPSKLNTATFKRVFLKEVSELSTYIDRSQLTPSLGGYFVYCHKSWVAFIKEMEAFVQEFLSVVQQLPSCISMLQALSKLPVPTTVSELQQFCFTNEARFQQLRRTLGLDELLIHCESVVAKLRHPETEPCYQAMAGTALFTHTAFDMLQNYTRITAAVEKVELLWHQAFSKARLQLQVLQLRDRALQITEQIETLLQEKLQPYKVEIARDAVKAVTLLSHFEVSIHIPAVALVRSAEDVSHTLAEILPLDRQSAEHWVLDLERLKEKLYSAVHFILQTLRSVWNYHQYYNKASEWYTLVLRENVLQELLSSVDTQQRRNYETIPTWRHRLSTFLKKSPPPSMEELLHLDHLSSVIPDDEVQKTGKEMAQRCTTLRKLLLSWGPASVGHLRLALHWQYELLRSSHGNQNCAVRVPGSPSESDLKSDCSKDAAQVCETAEGKPLSLHSLISHFDGAGTSYVETWGGRQGAGTSVCATSQPQIHEDQITTVLDADDPVFDFGSVERSSGASIHIIPQVTVEALNFEIKVKRIAALPNNPWLSLPVDDLESSYTVTITPNPTPQKRNSQCHDPCTNADHSPTLGDQGDSMEVLSSTQSTGKESDDSSILEDSVQSPLGNMLSSTITDGADRSLSTTEGNPTLLWDSYDLHQEAVDGTIDLSLKDWDVKEQEGLKEVEKILDRADEILKEEESVLAQEAVLDALLGSEFSHNHWPLYYSEDHTDGMLCSTLSEAADLGLDDSLDSAQSDSLSEAASSGSLTISEADTIAPHSSPDLLIALRIHELGCSQEQLNNKLSGSEALATEHRVSLETQNFQLQIEKMHVRKCLAGEQVPGETAEKAGAENQDQALCDLFQASDKRLSSSGNNFDSCTTEPIPAETGPDVFKEDRSHEVVPFCHGSASSVAPGKVGSQPLQSTGENEASGFHEDASMCKPEASLTLEMKPDDGEFDPGGNSILPLVPKPRRALLPLNNFAENEPFCTDGMHTQMSCGQDEALDPLPENVSTTMTQSPVFNANVKEHRNNNNNNNNVEEQRPLLDALSAVSRTDTGGASQAPASIASTDLKQTTETKASSRTDQHLGPSPPLSQHLEFDPGGTKLNKDLWDDDQTFDAMRVPEHGSPGIQAQLDSNTTQVSCFKTPIVLDTGSGLMKAGFADQDHPNVLFPTIIGRPKYEEIMNGDLEKETYIGQEAQRMRGILTLRHPIKNGVIRNWADMEKIWHHAFQQLCVDPEDHPVLLTEAAMNPLENRQRMVEIMFECFGVPFSYVAMQAVLALYASGRSTGVVFDSGDGVSHSVPVFEGYCLSHAVQRFPLAGADVTMQLKKLLQEQGVCLRTTAEMEIVREMKEKCCCVALNYDADLSLGAPSCREVLYTMPDGQVVTLGTERFRAPEILFKPELIGRDHHGMHESIFKSILGSDMDLRRCLLGNIVLSGGNTLLAGLPDRLQAEIKSLLPASAGQHVSITSPTHRDSSVWRGGAVLASLPTFSRAWISREEYEEYGPQIVFRKCF